MKLLFVGLGTLSIVLGVALTGRGASGIQIQVVITLVLNGLILIGIATVLGRLNRLISRLERLKLADPDEQRGAGAN
jgi:hypothetical protein